MKFMSSCIMHVYHKEIRMTCITMDISDIHYLKRIAGTFLFFSQTGSALSIVYLGSLFSVQPRPYMGTTLSFEIPALHTGQVCLFGLVSNH